MLCPVCKGSGSILSTIGGLKWWPCPACDTQGVLYTGIVKPEFKVRNAK